MKKIVIKGVLGLFTAYLLTSFILWDWTLGFESWKVGERFLVLMVSFLVFWIAAGFDIIMYNTDK